MFAVRHDECRRLQPKETAAQEAGKWGWKGCTPTRVSLTPGFPAPRCVLAPALRFVAARGNTLSSGKADSRGPWGNPEDLHVRLHAEGAVKDRRSLCPGDDDSALPDTSGDSVSPGACYCSSLPQRCSVDSRGPTHGLGLPVNSYRPFRTPPSLHIRCVYLSI